MGQIAKVFFDRTINGKKVDFVRCPHCGAMYRRRTEKPLKCARCQKRLWDWRKRVD